MTSNRALLSGLFLIVIALAFDLPALNYPIGDFSETGPGLFPIIVSSFLLLLGVIATARSFFIEKAPVHLQFKNIAIVLTSLAGFALLSEHVNMIIAIVFLVFGATYAGSTYSVSRNVKITIGLSVVAFMFQRLLHLNIKLF